MTTWFQFDKSERPAFYGTWPPGVPIRRSASVRGRQFLAQAAELDYTVDSADEWEEVRTATEQAANRSSRVWRTRRQKREP